MIIWGRILFEGNVEHFAERSVAHRALHARQRAPRGWRIGRRMIGGAMVSGRVSIFR